MQTTCIWLPEETRRTGLAKLTVDDGHGIQGRSLLLQGEHQRHGGATSRGVAANEEWHFLLAALKGPILRKPLQGRDGPLKNRGVVASPALRKARHAIWMGRLSTLHDISIDSQKA